MCGPRTVSCISEITGDLANLTVTHLFSWGVVVSRTCRVINSTTLLLHDRSSWVTELVSEQVLLVLLGLTSFNWREAALASPGLIWGRFSWYCPDFILSNRWKTNLSLYHYICRYISLDITINYLRQCCTRRFPRFLTVLTGSPITGLGVYHMWLIRVFRINTMSRVTKKSTKWKEKIKEISQNSFIWVQYFYKRLLT